MLTRPKHPRGQSLVEFALAFPLFILILMGLLDIGRAVYAFNTVSNASRESVRVAIVNQTTSDIEAEALKQAVSLGITDSEVDIAYAGTGDCTDGAPLPVGCIVAVTVRYPYTPATPIIGQLIDPFDITSTTEMPIERTCPDPSNAALITCPWP